MFAVILIAVSTLTNTGGAYSLRGGAMTRYWVLWVLFAVAWGLSSCSSVQQKERLAVMPEASLPHFDLNFGYVRVGEANVLRRALHNDGTESIRVSLEVSGSDGFTIDPLPGTYTMEPGQIAVLTVKFGPDKAGPDSCRIKTGDNDLGFDCYGVGSPGPSRSKYIRPFASNSIWNTPIGEDAAYVHAGFQPGLWIDVDQEHFLFDGQPVKLIANETWPNQCSGHLDLTTVWAPEGYIIPDDHKNHALACLLKDGKTVYSANPAARCDPAGPIYVGWAGVPDPLTDIYGEGIYGGHGGTCLSSVGGSIRLGELTSTEPIAHAIKIDVYAGLYCSKSGDTGHRWPAWRADAYWREQYDGYGEAVPAVKLGALLAIPSWEDINSLELQTAPARKLAWTLQNYGAYIADDSAWHTYYLCVEQGVPDEFTAAYGFPVAAQSGPWYDDMMKLMELLHVVDNNSPDSIGGGGKPLQPLSPFIGD
ncbi:MAG: hypothetical protein Q8Q20_03220 [bacterium]|nr:hypothetical protein [bacterium]